MADPRYEIPGGVAPDLTGAISMLIASRHQKKAEEMALMNAETQRKYAENQNARESARSKRDEQVFEQGQNDRRLKAVQSANELRRQGRHSEADMMLKLEGVDTTPAIGPSTTTPVETVTPMSAAAAMPPPPEAGHPGSMYEGPATADDSHTFTPTPMAAAAAGMPKPQTGVGTTVPEEMPAMPHVAAPDVTEQLGAPNAQEDLMPIHLGGETVPGKPTGAYRYSMGGKDIGTFDPASEEKYQQEKASRVTAALGPMGDKVAQIAALVAKNDITDAEGKALIGRLASESAAAAKVTDREDKQTFTREENDKYRNEGVSIADRNRWEEGRNKARLGAARATQINPLKVDTANRQDMGSLRQGFKEWKNTVNLSIDSKSHKRLATAMSNLDSGNSMQQREAAESLVSIFKGGGQVTKASQDLLLHHLAGIVGDAQTWIQQHSSGHFGDAELNVLKQATQNALKEEQERLHAYHDSAVDTFGPGSGYEQLGGNVNAMVKGAFRQFGYDAPDVYSEAPESVVLGSGKRPSTTKHGAAAPQTVTIKNKKTGETKEVSLEEARKMGAAP